MLSFKSGNHIFGPTLFRGQGAWKKAQGEASSDRLCMVNQTKKQQNEVFFKLFWQGLQQAHFLSLKAILNVGRARTATVDFTKHVYRRLGT